MTSPLNPPCFDPTDYESFTDVTGRAAVTAVTVGFVDESLN